MILGFVGIISFLVALVLYASLTVLWVWTLISGPLTDAYPNFALPFVFVPLMGYFFIQNPST